MSSDNEQQTTPAPEQPTTFKVFAGNLPFKLTEENLSNEFGAAGEVVTTNIITFGRRSLGYGFVEFNTEAEAQKAIELLNQKEIDGRQINVEMAKPKTQTDGNKPRRRRNRRRNNKDKVVDNSNDDQKNNADDNDGEQPKRNNRRRRNRKRNNKNNNSSEQKDGSNQDDNNDGNDDNNKPNRRNRRRKKDDTPKEPSTTTVFVANLPFSVNDESFEQIFSEKGHSPVSVRVASYKYRGSVRSRGYGFAEFENEEKQKAALELDGFEVEGRKISVHIANKFVPRANNDDDDDGNNGDKVVDNSNNDDTKNNDDSNNSEEKKVATSNDDDEKKDDNENKEEKK